MSAAQAAYDAQSLVIAADHDGPYFTWMGDMIQRHSRPSGRWLYLKLPSDVLFNSSSNFVPHVLAIQNSVCQASSFFFGANDFPTVSARYHFHLIPGTPPTVYVSRQSGPNVFAGNHLLQIVEQRFIHPAVAFVNQIIRVGNETHQSISFSDQLQLLFPQIDRVIVED